MKKAQVESQVFIYIFALITISLFLIYAFKFILAYQKNIYTTEMLTFIEDFKGEITNMAGQYRSTTIYKVKNAPSDYNQICFLNLKSCGSQIKDIPNHPIMSDSCKNSIEQNVFLTKNGMAQMAFYVKDLVLSNANNPYFCTNITSGRFQIKIVGNGDSASVIKVQ